MKSVIFLMSFIFANSVALAAPTLSDEKLIQIKEAWDNLVFVHECCTKYSEVLDMSDLSKYEDDYYWALETIYEGKSKSAGTIVGGNSDTMKMFLETNLYPLKLEDVVGVQKDGFFNGVANTLFGTVLSDIEDAFNDLLRVNEDVFPDNVYNVYEFGNEKGDTQAIVFINIKTNEALAIHIKGGDYLAIFKSR